MMYCLYVYCVDTYTCCIGCMCIVWINTHGALAVCVLCGYIHTLDCVYVHCEDKYIWRIVCMGFVWINTHGGLSVWVMLGQMYRLDCTWHRDNNVDNSAD